MKLSKITCGIMAFMLVFSASISAAAATFSDVPGANYAWAEEAVEQMAAQNIIVGQGGGKFGPADTIKKLDSMLLIARILGFNDSANDSLVETAIEKFQKKVTTYNLPYGEDEVCFLLARGVILESELTDYIGGSNYNKGLKRYEVAVLLTKAMGKEAQVKANMISVLDYDDESEIPSFAKKYVEFVTEQQLMQGMGDNKFSPNTDVNRAQMAVVLKKIMDLADYAQYDAIVSSIDALLGIIKFKDKDGNTTTYNVKDNVQLRFEGAEYKLDQITVGLEAVVTTSKGSLFAIDLLTPDIELEVTGSVESVTRGTASGTMIKIKKTGLTTTESVSYPLADTVVVTYSDKQATINDVKTGDFATLIVAKGKVTMIKAEPSEKTVKGLVRNITIGDNALTVLIENTDTSTEEEYILSGDVTLTKNTKTAELSTLRSGDSVSMTLRYDVVTKIVATSKSKNGAGFIESILIAPAASEITLKMDGSSVVYPISKDAEVTVNGKKGTIYDLRLSSTATISVESDEIVKITVTQATEVEQFTGTVDLINSSYGLMQVTCYDTVTEQSITRSVFVGASTKIMNNATGKDTTLKAMTTGVTVSVIGSVNTGVFEATTVIVLG